MPQTNPPPTPTHTHKFSLSIVCVSHSYVTHTKPHSDFFYTLKKTSIATDGQHKNSTNKQNVILTLHPDFNNKTKTKKNQHYFIYTSNISIAIN